MRTKIIDVAALSSGVYAKAGPNADVYYIQARDISGDHRIVNGMKPELIADGKINKHFLQVGDLLVAAKGKDHFAVEYCGQPQPAVASTLFIVLRVREDAGLSASYLRWYINLEGTQKHIAGSAQGSVLQVISKADLEQLELPLPSMEKQAIILKIDELRRKEIAITNQIELLKSKKIERELLNALSQQQ